MEDLKEVYEIIAELELDVIDHVGDQESIFDAFELYSNGFCIIVEFLGQEIWNSENDERECQNQCIDEDEVIYEPLEPYLRTRTNEIISAISELNL